MKKMRNRQGPLFNAKVALAAHKGDRTVAELARDFGVRPHQVSAWKKKLFKGAAGIFEAGGTRADEKADEA